MAARLAARLPAFALGGAASLAVVLLYVPWITAPHIRYDDFNFLTKSRTVADTWAHLFQPMNEHVMPLARASAGVLMQLTPRQSSIPLAAEIQGVLAVVLGMWLLFQFVRRELGHDFYGIVAMTLWGRDDDLLRVRHVVLGVLLHAGARYDADRTARGSGVQSRRGALGTRPVRRQLRLGAGLPQHRPARRPVQRAVSGRGTVRWLGWSPVAAPHGRGGCGPRAGNRRVRGVQLRRRHWRDRERRALPGKTIFAAFDPVEGLRNSIRTLADNQIPGAVGIWNKTSVFSWRSASSSSRCWPRSPRMVAHRATPSPAPGRLGADPREQLPGLWRRAPTGATSAPSTTGRDTTCSPTSGWCCSWSAACRRSGNGGSRSRPARASPAAMSSGSQG